MADGFQVTSVNQTQRLNAGGNLVDYVDLLFELDNGAGSGSVSVPLTEDWEAQAEAAVKAQAASMTNLLNL